MKSRRDRSKRLRVLHLWSLAEVEKAVPYLRSVVASLREHWLEVLNTERRGELAAKDPKSQKKTGLLAKAYLQDDRRRAQQRFDDTLEELNKLDVFLLDAVQGVALIPFRKEDDLAWFVFDQFTARGLVGWRNHSDPIEECRPLDLLPAPAATDPVSNER